MSWTDYCPPSGFPASLTDGIWAWFPAAVAANRISRSRFADQFEPSRSWEPITVHVAVDVREDEVAIDFAGSSPQFDRGLNVVLNYATAYANYALKCALAPEVPNNAGSFRPVRVTAPEGSIFNPRFPAAVAARQLAGHFAPHAIFGALAPAIPGRVLAEGAGRIWLTNVRGLKKKQFVAVFFAAGGTGARSTSDGLATTSFPSGVATAPVEVIEASSPLVFRRKEWRPDSGGGQPAVPATYTRGRDLHARSPRRRWLLRSRRARPRVNSRRPGKRFDNSGWSGARLRMD